ncbi:MAG: hypothetical protein HYU28_07135 [Actinobacteria bacterium]|nr:hypothetical protein [Actinomycetota bacterium]
MRRLAVIVAALALAGIVAPVHRAAAADSTTIVFSGRITLWNDLDDNGNVMPSSYRVGMWAPVSPACGSTPCPRPTQRFFGQTDWRLDQTSHPLDLATCTAFDSSGGAAAHVGSVNAGQPCTVSAWGSFLDGIFNVGPYCGYSRGPLNLTVTVGGTTRFLVGLSTQHVGTELVWEMLRDNSTGQVGRGVMTLADARGECGLSPTDNFAPATEFDASATITWTDAV